MSRKYLPFIGINPARFRQDGYRWNGQKMIYCMAKDDVLLTNR